MLPADLRARVHQRHGVRAHRRSEPKERREARRGPAGDRAGGARIQLGRCPWSMLCSRSESASTLPRTACLETVNAADASAVCTAGPVAASRKVGFTPSRITAPSAGPIFAGSSSASARIADRAAASPTPVAQCRPFASLSGPIAAASADCTAALVAVSEMRRATSSAFNEASPRAIDSATPRVRSDAIDAIACFISGDSTTASRRRRISSSLSASQPVWAVCCVAVWAALFAAPSSAGLQAREDAGQREREQREQKDQIVRWGATPKALRSHGPK
ncbi:MAG: hypothetical protein JOZ69_02720 [Myxococcales bacterium]|nr:hypothetical protein [Myxococcales bacterium]